MKRIFLAAIIATFAAGSALAQDASCEAKAMGKDGAILGMTLFNASAEEFREIHAGIGAGLENGTLRPVIGQEFKLADAPRAHQAVMEPGAFGKIVLVP